MLRVRWVLISPQSNTGALSKSPLGSNRFLVTSPAFYPNQSDRPGSQLWEEFLVLLFPFMDDGGHCIHWDLQCSRKFFSTPSQNNSVSEVYRLGLHATLYPVRYENFALSTLHCRVPTWHTSLLFKTQNCFSFTPLFFNILCSITSHMNCYLENPSIFH